MTDRLSALRDSVRFLGSFARRPQRVGAVLPSSRALAEALVGDLSTLQAGDVLVEYGPGTGPMTRVIAERLPDGVDYLGIELDAGFHALLEQRFPRLEFVQASAAEVGAILQARSMPSPRRIVSGIPFASLGEEIQRGIINGTASALAADGEFRTFQYAHAYRLAAAKRFRSMMEEAFSGFRREGPVLRNVPPAYVLVYGHGRS